MAKRLVSGSYADSTGEAIKEYILKDELSNYAFSERVRVTVGKDTMYIPKSLISQVAAYFSNLE